MKGIAHFAVGSALASFIPSAVNAAMEGNPLYMVLGGVFGLLPDTLDFKFYRYFARHDVEVTPDPLCPDAELIAETVAAAIHSARGSGKPVRLRLDTIRLGADRWRQYEVIFDVCNRKVRVEIGPECDTGGVPLPGAEDGGGSAEQSLACGIKLDYEAVVRICAFDGPLIVLERNADGSVSPRFIPWHRLWSHSLTLAGGIGIAMWAAVDGAAGVVSAAAFAAHALTDHLGFMGSNLWFPMRMRRQEGLKRLHSDEAGPNFWTVWGSCVVVFGNLWRMGGPALPPFDPLWLFLYAGLFPFLISRLLCRTVRNCRPED